MTILVNDVEIREEAVAREVQFHPAASLEEARREAARALVVRELLLQEAHRLALVPAGEPDEGEDDGALEDADNALIRTLLERAVTVPEPDEGQCRRHHQEHAGRYGSPELYEAAHILFPAPPEDAEARAAAERRAAETLAALQVEPRRFAEFARERSACPSAAEGGGLGQFTADQMVAEVIAALDATEPGALHPLPVATRFGYHVLRLDHREAGRPLPFERVRERIAVELYDWHWRQAVHGFIGGLASRARIQGVDMSTAH